jgi:hypothetical protein
MGCRAKAPNTMKMAFMNPPITSNRVKVKRRHAEQRVTSTHGLLGFLPKRSAMERLTSLKDIKNDNGQIPGLRHLFLLKQNEVRSCPSLNG